MIASMRAELFKLRKRTTIWVIGVVWLLLSLVFGYLFPYLSYRSGAPTGPAVGGAGPTTAGQVLSKALPDSLASTSIQGLPMFAGALALILGVLSAGSEYGWQTMKVAFTQGPPRLAVLAGKLAALLLTILVVVLATFLVDAGAAWLVAAVESKPMVWPPVGDIVLGILAGWLIVAMWATFGMLLAILMRGTAPAVGLGLVWALAVENLLRLFASKVDGLDVLQRWLPGTNAGALAAALGVTPQGQPGGAPGVTAVVGGARATLVLLVYVAALATMSAFVVNRRDVT